MAAQQYPLPGFSFSVDWGGTNLAFSEVSGISEEYQMIEYRGGLSPEMHTVKMPGLKKFGDVTLKRGFFTGDNQMYDWWNATIFNIAERRDITISLLNEARVPVVTWTFSNCVAVKLEGAAMKADGNEVAIETLTFACESMRQVNVA
jgi:phage tail-like protein